MSRELQQRVSAYFCESAPGDFMHASAKEQRERERESVFEERRRVKGGKGEIYPLILLLLLHQKIARHCATPARRQGPDFQMPTLPQVRIQRLHGYTLHG